ncbi:glycoside hydrolase family 6 protein [Streptomyces stramineus]
MGTRRRPRTARLDTRDRYGPRHAGPRRKHASRRRWPLLRYGAVLLVCAGAVGVTVPAGLAHTVDDEWDATSPFWAEPTGPAASQVRIWEERGREEDAAILRRIADRPTAVWLTGNDPKAQAEQVTRRAERAGRIPVLVAYNIPQRDCGQYSSGGAADAAHYRTWVSRAAAGIGTRQAWIILEPDALAQWASGCVPAAAAKQRLALLTEAVETFKALPATSVYIDAGNAGWIPDQHRLADALTRSGIGRADGFALNVSNFHTTPVTREYGDRLSALLHGTHYVVDTSRNGNGPLQEEKKPAGPEPGPAAGAGKSGAEPAPDQAPDRTAGAEDDIEADEADRATEDSGAPGPGDAEPWCNPPGRALGTPPTTATGHPLIDAFLWIKRPGESDGACRGAPAAGRWWADYALRLAGATPTSPPAAPGPPPASTPQAAPRP